MQATLNDLLFRHWLRRQSEILQDGCGTWRGNRHPEPIILHRLIDDQLDQLRPLINTNLSIYSII